MSAKRPTPAEISAIYVPPLNDKPLKELVAQKQNGELSEQNALAKLNRQNNWDVALSVGVHQQVNPVAYGPQPYGAVSVNYNLSNPGLTNIWIAPSILMANGRKSRKAMWAKQRSSKTAVG